MFDSFLFLLLASMSFLKISSPTELLRTRIDSRWGIVCASRLLLLRLVVSSFFLSSRRKPRNEDKEHKKNFPLLSWVEWQKLLFRSKISRSERGPEIGTTTTKTKSKRFWERKKRGGDIFFLLFIWCGGSGRVYQIWPRSDTTTLKFSVCLAIVLLLLSSSICREQVKRWKWK